MAPFFVWQIFSTGKKIFDNFKNLFWGAKGSLPKWSFFAQIDFMDFRKKIFSFLMTSLKEPTSLINHSTKKF
jgi:hypothetical protein